MVLSFGKYWIKLNKEATAMISLVDLLNATEQYIGTIRPEIANCDYWALCRDNDEENIVVNLAEGLDGEPLGVAWDDVCNNVIGLAELFETRRIHPYIGRNKAGNWGIHRHIHDMTSQWNMCILGKGNSGGAVGFHRTNDEGQYETMSDEHIYDVLDGNHHDQMTGSVMIEDGDILSIHTIQWHSHRVPRSDNRTEAFLLHPMNARTQEEAIRIFHAW